MKKKGQVGLEFMLVTGVALFTLIVFGVVLFQIMSVKQEEKAMIMAEDLVLSIQQEINFAANAEPGYSRIVELPNKIEGFDYEIALYTIGGETSYFELSVANGFFPRSIPLTNGELKPGALLVSKRDADVFVEVIQ